jgi:hypothetical protein
VCASDPELLPLVVVVSVPLCVSDVSRVPLVVVVSVPLCVSLFSPVADRVPLIVSSSVRS